MSAPRETVTDERLREIAIEDMRADIETYCLDGAVQAEVLCDELTAAQLPGEDDEGDEMQRLIDRYDAILRAEVDRMFGAAEAASEVSA